MSALTHQLQPDEKDVKCLTAFTPEQYTPPYPWYVNLTMVRMKGDVVLTVRLPTNYEATPREPGQTSSVRLTREMWDKFVEQVREADERWRALDFIDSIL